MNNEKPRKEINPVADMMNWNEVIRKESKNNRIYDTFMIHPTSSKLTFCRIFTISKNTQ